MKKVNERKTGLMNEISKIDKFLTRLTKITQKYKG